MSRRNKIRGRSYWKRVEDINRIYAEHIADGLSNREILRRYIQPLYPISESTLYNMLNAVFKETMRADKDEDAPSLFDDEAF